MNRFRFKNVMYGLLAAAIVWLGVILGHSFVQESSPPVKTMRITVFIHGTVGSSFNILNPWQCCSEKFNDNSLSSRTVKRFRSYDGMNYDQILGSQGLTEFCEQDLPVWHAARYVIPAYDACVRSVKNEIDLQKYLVFGWSGFLHNGARKDAGYELYHALCDYRDHMVARYNIDPEIEIVAHSHGGNVALWLAQAEKEFKRGLRVKALVMLGTPMQKEMISGLESEIFRTIVLCYSQGDGVQQRDYFSTKGRKSYQHMADIVDIKGLVQKNPHLRRHDVACIANNNDRHVTHTNMWMAGRSNPVLDGLDPLPLVVFMPALVWLLDQHVGGCTHEFYIADSGEGCDIGLHQQNLLCHACKNCVFFDGKVLRKQLCVWSEKMKAEWQVADDKSRHVLFNRKNFRALKHAIWG